MEEHQFGHYRLEELIGVGGMGEVWRAHDTRRDRQVALKLLPDSLARDGEFLRRFRREPHVAARLREPHVIPIHDYGEIDGRLYIDMRLVDGRDLGDLLREGPLQPARAVTLLSQVADALQAAHEDGLVHRDVKPSNILVTRNDFVYVVDFGIARPIGVTGTSLTITGATVGTLDYMAPERFTNQPLDARVDVYSLACVLHEALTAQRPFRGEDLPSLLYAHLYTDPSRLSELAPDLPAALDDVAARGMAKRPEDRFGSVCELMAAARAAVAEPVAAAPAAAPAPETIRSPLPVTPPAFGGAGPTPALGIAAADGSHRSVDQLSAPAGSRGRPAGPSAARRPRHRRWAWVTAALAVLLLVGGLLTVVLRPWDDSTVSAATPTSTGTGSATAGAVDQQSPGKPAPAPAPSLAVPTTLGFPIPVPADPEYMEIAPNGRYAYIAHPSEGVVSVLDLTSLQINSQIHIDAGPPHFVTFAPDGSRAYITVTNADYTRNFVVFLDTASNRVIDTVPVGHRPFAPATSPDGRLLYVPLHNEGRVQVLDAATGDEVGSYPVPPNPHWIAVSADGTRGYTANHESDVISVLDLAHGGAVLATIPAGDSPHSVALSPDGRRVAAVAYDSNEVYVVDTANDQPVGSRPVGANPQDVTWAPDGAHFYTADSQEGTMSVIDAGTLAVTATIPAGVAPTCVAVSPDGTRAYVTDLMTASVRIFALSA